MPSNPTPPADTGAIAAVAAIADTRRWLDRAVVGLNLCPFARSVQVHGRIHYAACTDTDPEVLLEALLAEAGALVALDPGVRDTTLLVATGCLGDFLDFNDFAGRAEDRLADAGFEGELQLATFHPDFRFGGTAPDDIGNATNRTPWPTLHLLRESSVDRAVAAFPDAEDIYLRNIDTLERIGAAGWAALDVGPGAAARHPTEPETRPEGDPS